MSGRNLNAIRRNESVGRGQSIIFSNGGFDSSDEDSVTLEATCIINSSEGPQFNQVGIQSKFMKFMLSCFVICYVHEESGGKSRDCGR